eukprot:gene14734-14861_t
MTALSIKPRRNWDPIVKLTHWSVVAAILGNSLLTEGGSWPHIWVGFALAAVLVLRLLWGLVGPAEARFSAFAPSPRRALAHIRAIREGHQHHEPSHNPLGALMVYAIWSTLGVIIATGIAMAGLPPHAVTAHDTPAAATIAAPNDAHEIEAGNEAETEEGGPLKEVHEAAANLLYVLIALHIAGVAFETRRSGRRKTLQHKTLILSIVLVFQVLAAMFFAVDVASDIAVAGIDQHLFVELAVTVALWAGVVVGAVQVSAMIAHAKADDALIAMAKGAMADLVRQRFAQWALTDAEADVALFAIKGLSGAIDPHLCEIGHDLANRACRRVHR